MDTLRDLVNDENPMVVANTVAVLTEIEQAQGTKILRITTSILQKLIAALSDCTSSCSHSRIEYRLALHTIDSSWNISPHSNDLE